MFSSRVPGVMAPNRLSAAVAAHRASGRRLLDLTATNPTTVGFHYPEDVLAPLARTLARTYQPEPFGLPEARRAVAADYARRGISVAEGRIVLTASTSEAYSLLLKLLCAPAGDDVLAPAPGYPLFDHLTTLDGVNCRAYNLEYHGRWVLDEQSVDGAWTDRTRAVMAVSPNNPTGSVLTGPELDALAGRCRARDAALIVDEVFADYDLKVGDTGSVIDNTGSVIHATGSVAQTKPPALTFRLGGLSKSAGLPQVKLGWIAVDGPDDLVGSALDRLELICDTYLSVSTPVQVAAPALIAQGAHVREQIQRRVRANFATLRDRSADDPSVGLLHADAGWSAVLRVPARQSEEEIVLSLVRTRDTLVHPGFFFDFPREAFLVVSLLPDPAVFAEGVDQVMEQVRG